MAQELNKETVREAAGRTTSHGRGGAGNISSNSNTGYDAKDLATPTIKGTTYTTGRGGSGNMVPNENADTARAAQDVDVPGKVEKAPSGTYHWGRGGEGNMMTLGTKNTARKEMGGEHQRRGSFQGAIEKGKEMLGLNKNQSGK